MITRFAPSPTGPLHLGHAFSALTAWEAAIARGGTFLLRIDDLDQTRARPEWEDLIYQDLRWLGLDWPTPCRRESECMRDYEAALDRLWAMGLLYPCTCTRRDIREALSAPHEQPDGPDGPVYPGTCRGNMAHERANPECFARPVGVTLRLDMAQAVQHSGLFKEGSGGFDESGHGPNGETGRIEFTPEAMVGGIGDVVVARRDFGAAYHLAVVVDDWAQGVTHVVRGEDLFEATKIHVVLQKLLGLPTPVYHHHRLIRDAAGKRLAKRDDARAIRTYREEGRSPDELRAMLGL